MTDAFTQTQPVPTLKTKKASAWKVGLCLLAIFVGGVAIGAVATVRVLRYEVSRRADPARWTLLLLDRVDHQLHLTPDQRHALEPLVRSGMHETMQVRDHAFADIAGIVERTRAQAAPTLTVEQRQRLDAFIKNRTDLLTRWLGNASPRESATPAPSPSR